MTSKEEKVKYWIEISDYDFETAGAMHETGRYLYVGFMCHQSVEKLLKGLYFFQTEETPPYIHSLSRIAEKCDILVELEDYHLETLFQLEPLNIEARYPSYKEQLLQSLGKEKSEELLERTNKILQWIKQKL